MFWADPKIKTKAQPSPAQAMKARHRASHNSKFLLVSPGPKGALDNNAPTGPANCTEEKIETELRPSMLSAYKNQKADSVVRPPQGRDEPEDETLVQPARLDTAESVHLATEMTERNVAYEPNLDCETIDEGDNEYEDSVGDDATEHPDGRFPRPAVTGFEEEVELLELLNQTGLQHRRVQGNVPTDPTRGHASQSMLDHTMLTGQMKHEGELDYSRRLATPSGRELTALDRTWMQLRDPEGDDEVSDNVDTLTQVRRLKTQDAQQGPLSCASQTNHDNASILGIEIVLPNGKRAVNPLNGSFQGSALTSFHQRKGSESVKGKPTPAPLGRVHVVDDFSSFGGGSVKNSLNKTVMWRVSDKQSLFASSMFTSLNPGQKKPFNETGSFNGQGSGLHRSFV